MTAPGGSAQSYTTDAYGQVATAPGGVSYGYDALGRLATRTAGGTTTSMSYLGTSGTLAFDGSRDYTWDPAGNAAATQVPGGSAFSTVSNAHGDLAATFSPASTAAGLAGYASYAPYGAPSASGYQADVGYQGGYTDPATGQVMMGARWYAPAAGSFTTTDTIAGMPLPSTADGNPYAYTAGSPLVQADPSGHRPVDWPVPLVPFVTPRPLPGRTIAPPRGIPTEEPTEEPTQGPGIGIYPSPSPTGAGEETPWGWAWPGSVAQPWGGAPPQAGPIGPYMMFPKGWNGLGPWSHTGESGGSGSRAFDEMLRSLGLSACARGCDSAPPPPPRDCIQAGTCPKDPIPHSLETAVITHKTQDATDPATLGCHPGHCIRQQPTAPNGPVTGTTVGPAAAGDTSAADLDTLIQAITSIGQPGTPGDPATGGGVTPGDGPVPQTAAGGSDNMQGGPPPPAVNGACDDEGGGEGRRSLKDLADQVRLGARHPAAANQRVIAIGEDSLGGLSAGSSAGFDAGQRAVLRRLGIGRVPAIPGYHAEEEVLMAVPDLVRIGISGQPPCGPEKHNCLQKLTDAGVEIECLPYWTSSLTRWQSDLTLCRNGR